MPELTLFGFLLALTFLDECRRAATERRLQSIESYLRWLIVMLLGSVAVSVVLFLLLGAIGLR